MVPCKSVSALSFCKLRLSSAHYHWHYQWFCY